MSKLSDIENSYRAKLGISSTERIDSKQSIDEPTGVANAGTDAFGEIKVIRESLGYGLAEAKELVESAPCIVYTCTSFPEAQQLCDKLLAAGANARVS